MAQQGLALLGQRHAARKPDEERAVERRFEPPNGFGQARLGDAERLGGGAETAVAGDCIEIADLGEFHEPIPLGYGKGPSV